MSEKTLHLDYKGLDELCRDDLNFKNQMKGLVCMELSNSLKFFEDDSIWNHTDELKMILHKMNYSISLVTTREFQDNFNFLYQQVLNDNLSIDQSNQLKISLKEIKLLLRELNCTFESR